MPNNTELNLNNSHKKAVITEKSSNKSLRPTNPHKPSLSM